MNRSLVSAILSSTALFSLFTGGGLFAAVRITELMYNPPLGDELEYIEIHNSGAAPEDLSGWAFADGITFQFAPGTVVPPDGYLVICRSREKVHAAYPEIPESILLGDYEGGLDNDGERIILADASGAPRLSFRYEDDSPWEFLADGFGASLEILCEDADPALPENWRASPVPANPAQRGGTPGRANTLKICPPERLARPRVLISEIMYHPALEEDLVDNHEFVEIHSAESEEVDLGGWRLAGGIDFTFPAGTRIAPAAYRVIAKNKARLAAVAAYGLAESEILGNYERALGNGGDKVALIGPDGQGIDSVTYDDEFPWPLAADDFGAGESWLRSSLLPMQKHRYMGHSLERVSFAIPAGEVYNWAPSPVDGATPGRANASARETPLPIVVRIDASPAGGGPDPLIRAADEVRIAVRLAPAAPTGPVEIEYFIEDLTRTDEPRTVAAMADDGAGNGDAVAGDLTYTVVLPPRPDSTIVRYRILADLGAGKEAISPRPTDPHDWHAYFVSPAIDTRTRLYQVFISPANWGRMWTNIQANRVTGCTANPSWDAEVPAIFVHEGKVTDAQVRYQGSRYNRTNGPNISRWNGPLPIGGPNPVRALSWRVQVPRHNAVDGRTVMTLNKLTQGCPGYNAGVGYRLFELAGVPGSNARFIRLHVNGIYYHYMMELERPGSEMMERYHREMSERDPSLPREEVGHLYKSAGCNCDEGPYGWGDERPLLTVCGYAPEVRYQYTYDRKTHDWGGHGEFMRLIEDLNTARRSGVEAIRDYFAANYDLDLLLNYIAIINWSVPFDDMFQNHFIYQRLSDGKWFLFPWDLDRNFGEWQGPSSSVYMGESGVSDNRSGWWNYLKDAFLKAYREEYNDRLLLLNNTILHPDVVSDLVDQVAAEADPQEAASAPAGVSCGAAAFQSRALSFKSFAQTRYTFVNNFFGLRIDAGPDQVVFPGQVVQFDATASNPDPSPEVNYTWSNGMEGELPTFVFEEPGDHVITLSMVVRGIRFEDSVTIHVLPLPERAFQERDGQVVIEAESFFQNERHDMPDTRWEFDTANAGFSGTGYMHAKEDRRRTFLRGYTSVAPELRYTVLFENTGAYRVWIRGLALSRASDSVYLHIDGQERESLNAHEFLVTDPPGFVWSGLARDLSAVTVEVTRPGLHLLSVWIRESNFIIDKIILTKDDQFAPADLGPPESGTARVHGEAGPPFVRGDLNANGLIDFQDAILILLHLFRGGPLIECPDHGDADDSGTLENTDAVVLLVYFFLDGPPPPAPFPAPGHDPTPDANTCGDP